MKSLFLAAAAVLSLAACTKAPVADSSIRDADGAAPGQHWVARLQSLAFAYNVFSRGDVEYSCSDFEGRLGARGNVWLSRFRVGPKIQDPWAANVGGAFVLRDGSTDGGVSVGGTAWLQNYSVTGVTSGGFPTCSLGSGSCSQAWTPAHVSKIRQDLDVAGEAFVAVADEVKERAAATGKAVTLVAGELVFEVTTPGPNAWYFRVSASDLAAATKVTVRAPADAVIAIDVAGADASLVGISDFFILEGARASNVLLSFAGAQTLAISDAVIFANVLAPRAATRFTEGRIEGGLYVGSLWGNPMQTDYTTPLGSCVKSGGQVNFVPFYSI